MVLLENASMRVATLEETDYEAVRRLVDGGAWRESVQWGLENAWHALRPETALEELDGAVADERASAFACHDLETGALCAVIGLTGISMWTGRATVLFWCDAETVRAKRLAEPLKRLVRHAFSTLLLRRLTVAVPEGALETTVKSFGFVKEGTVREWIVPRPGEDPVDCNLYGCVRSECLVLAGS
ncbi:MAG: hypothetical protein MI724_09465 [Spirochaetales bacterium]|nr:hypothetical protein [Spirochaetales bacterium]